MIPFFKTPGLGELRRQEYERYHCNDFFNDVNSVWSNVPEVCRKYQNSIGYYVFDGAHCKSQVIDYFYPLVTLIYVSFIIAHLYLFNVSFLMFLVSSIYFYLLHER